MEGRRGGERLCRQIKGQGIRKILNEHYFKHPLAKVPQLRSTAEE